jgi:hypothetical protein
MKKYIVSGAALLLGALASPAYCTTVILAFSYIPTPPGTGTITYTPSGSAGINPATLNSFTGIPFDNVMISGDPIAGDNSSGGFAFTSSGSAFAFTPSSGPLTNSGSFTTASGTASGSLFSLTGLSYTAYTTNSLSNIEVGFSNTVSTTGTVSASLETALGLTGPLTITLVQDAFCGSTPPGSYPQATGMACAAGYNASNGSSAGGVDSQYLEVSISTTTTTPEPETSLMLGIGLVAVGSLARKRRQKA